MPDIHVVVLAAGKGTRMKSQLPKVLHRIAGLTHHRTRAQDRRRFAAEKHHGGRGPRRRRGPAVAREADPAPVRHAGTAARNRPRAAPGADAVWKGRTGTVVLLSGDVPLLTVDSLQALLATHSEAAAAATVITANLQRPFGYGRIVRTNGKISKIVEERDTTAAQKAITEINSGIYAFDLAPLFAALDTIGTANKQGEYYLPDLVAIYRKQKRAVATWTVERADEIRGINSRTELAEVSTMVRQQKNEELMAAGVTLIDPATTYVDADVVVGPDTVIYPCVFLEGSTKIGAACEIHSGARIVNSTIGDRVCVRNHTVVTDSTVEAGAFVGPFAHIRPGSEVGEDAHIGNFVELKKTVMGKGAKANHLAYLGDATIGAKTNVGAGTITCNYDGEKKHQTVIGNERVRRQQQHARRAGYPGRWLIHCSRLRGHDGCAGRRARHWPVTPGKQRGLGGEAERRKGEITNVRNCRLRWTEAGRAGPDRGIAQARISRLRLGRRRRRPGRRDRSAAQRRQADQPRKRHPGKTARRRLYGLGHTRWATHGRPTEENAHPHRDGSGRIVVVHNGIIENYLEIKRELVAEGHTFGSETDTEVVAHLVQKEWKDDGLEHAVLRAMKRVRGLFALVLLSADDPEKLVTVRNGPPIVVGIGDGEYFVASDVPAILEPHAQCRVPRRSARWPS